MDSQITKLIDAVRDRGSVSPFIDIDLTVPVEVLVLNHGDETLGHSGIKWVTLPFDPELPALIANAKSSSAFLREDVEEIWHADCPVGETGLLADEEGAVSRLINKLREGLAWPHQIPSLDKVILSKSAAWQVSGFHTDHFPFGDGTRRSRGSATRVITNLGMKSRFVCFLLHNGERALPLGDDYCSDDYKGLTSLLTGAVLIITALPPYSHSSGIAGVEFDAHNLLHCGLPYQGAVAAVITDWNKRDGEK